MRKLGTIVVVAFLAGCAKDFKSPFVGNPGVSPLTAETTFCKPDVAGKYPTDTFTVGDKGAKDTHFFALGGGCIGRPLKEVWATARKAATWQWARSELTSFEPVKSEAAPLVFGAHYEAGGAPFTQHWTIEYYHTVVKGQADAPEAILIRYKKTEGTGFIPFWEGTLELTALPGGVTGLVMRDEIEAAQTDLDDSVGNVRDTLTRLRKPAR